MKIGYEIFEQYPGVALPLDIDLEEVCHWLIIGGSGSGKTVFLLYALNNILNSPISLYLADFKGSGDFLHLTSDYAEFGNCVELIERFYCHYQEIKEKKNGNKILLIFDEYAGFLIWLEGQDKKKATEIKNKIAEILMQGRALPGGGSAWFWAVCQRADSTYFAHGARDNYMLIAGLGRLSKESRGMLFSGEDIPEYTPCVGRGLILTPGKPVRVFQVPDIDKAKIIQLLQRKAADRRSRRSRGAFRRST